MGIKCSLFGHAFGETNVERDREEQGSEVVSTIREIETCTRCGQQRVVSENKEVTTLETPDDVELDDQPAQQADQPNQQADQPDQQTDQPSAAPEIAEAEAGVGDDGSATPEEPADVDETEAETASVEEEPPVTDDAEILDEDDEDGPEREPGEWPQEAGEDTAEEQVDAEFNQLGYDDPENTVEEDKTDAEFIDEDDEEDDSAPEPETNEWPSESEIDAATEPESAGPGAVTVPEGSFVCEGCGFSTPVESSSLREGDFCPECHQETLIQVREQP